MYSGFCIKDSKPYYKEGYEKRLLALRRAKYKVYDIENEKVYDLNGEIIIESDKLEENYTYTCEIQTYSSNGEKAAYKSQKYTVAKSGFSVTGVTKPTGELIYKKGFTVKGVVGSAYPITDAKIVIFTKGNENDIKDILSFLRNSL